MKVIVHPIKEPLYGTIRIPSSKSHAQRALALSMIAQGQSCLKNIGQSEDEQAVLKVVQEVTNGITIKGNNTYINGVNANEILGKTYSIGESGLATRMLTPILANSSNALVLRGQGSILTRPMHFFNAVLPHLHVDFNCNEGKLPFHIQGPLVPKDTVVDGSLSSQFVTGVLYGFIASPLLRNEVLHIENLASRPYFELSIDVLRSFGVNLNFEHNQIQFNGPYTLKPATIQIEGDWSSASFLLIAGALSGKISISNLQQHSKQADKAILTVLADFGAQLDWEDDTLTVTQKTKHAFHFDATNCPDLFPPLAVLAAFGNGKSTIKGISRLTHKESNRALTIQQEFQKVGITITLDYDSDLMTINPISTYSGGIIDSHNDHRIAMAGAILALNASEPITIMQAEAVKKSFVEFWECLEKLEVTIEIM